MPGATITRGIPSASAERPSGQLSPCFVLHHMGFFVRSRSREDPVGSYPAFSPLPDTIGCQWPLPVIGETITDDCSGYWQPIVSGGLFSVTLSVTRDLDPGTLVFTRHAALRCSDFPLARKNSSQRSSATLLRYHRPASRSSRIPGKRMNNFR
jgi:hypothetical protein